MGQYPSKTDRQREVRQDSYVQAKRRIVLKVYSHYGPATSPRDLSDFPTTEGSTMPICFPVTVVTSGSKLPPKYCGAYQKIDYGLRQCILESIRESNAYDVRILLNVHRNNSQQRHDSPSFGNCPSDFGRVPVKAFPRMLSCSVKTRQPVIIAA